jgi:transcriptional regulator with XRE-family HTH domain
MNKLAELRERFGLSQAEMAKLSGLSPAVISLLEKGNRDMRLTTALALSDALNVSVYALVGKVEYPHNEETLRIELTKAKQKLAKIHQLTDPNQYGL